MPACSRAIDAGVAYYVAAPVRRGRPAAALRGGAAPDRLPARALRLRRVHQPRPRCCAAASPRSISGWQRTLADLLARWHKADGSFRSRKLMLRLGQRADAPLGAGAAVPQPGVPERDAARSARRDCRRTAMPRRRQRPCGHVPAWRTDAASARDPPCAASAASTTSRAIGAPTRRPSGRWHDSIAHRGPDDEGFHFDGPLGLGFRRLSIIDLAGGHQPMIRRRRVGLGGVQRRDLQLPGAAPRAGRPTATCSAPAPTPRSSSTATSSGAPACCSA